MRFPIAQLRGPSEWQHTHMGLAAASLHFVSSSGLLSLHSAPSPRLLMRVLYSTGPIPTHLGPRFSLLFCCLLMHLEKHFFLPFNVPCYNSSPDVLWLFLPLYQLKQCLYIPHRSFIPAPILCIIPSYLA